MKKLILFFAFLFAIILQAQNAKVISELSGNPVPKVLVFGDNGNILTSTDIDGNFDRAALTPKQEKYQFVYNNNVVGDYTYDELNKDKITINEKIKNISAVVIKNNKPAKYLMVQGNFNTFVAVNGSLNVYADGIATYIFDSKTKKLKRTKVEQYRVYTVLDPKEDNKKLDTWSYTSFLKLPALKKVSELEELKSRKSLKYKELKSQNKDEVEFSRDAFKDREINFLGYRFYDVTTILNMSFEKDQEKSIKSFLEYNEIQYLKVKHKSEPEYNQFIIYGNFYPTEMSFKTDDEVEKVKFKADNSNYTSEFWNTEGFPNMLPVFNKYYKDTMKEMPNKK